MSNILVDLDGVIADFEHGFLTEWRKKYPEEKLIPIEERKTFYILEDYPLHLRKKVRKIYTSPGFFSKLKPVRGSIKALKSMQKLGYNIFICSSPIKENSLNVKEKYDWIKVHLGQGWVDKTIIIRDKTLIQGDLLIDDRPKIEGLLTPSWEHIIFDQPYNRNIKNKKRINWQNWREKLIL